MAVVLLISSLMISSACSSDDPVLVDDSLTTATLFPPHERTETSILIAWSGVFDLDFASYSVLRSLAPDVSTQNGEVVATYDDVDSITHLDEGLSAGTAYYYRILVTRSGGVTTWSNEIRAETRTPVEPGPEPPAAVFLSPIVGRSVTSIELAWSPSEAEDFASYTVLRSDNSGVSEADGQVLAEIADRTTTGFADDGLSSDTTYYYRVIVRDTEGLSALSNEVSGTTVGEADPTAPDSVLLYSPVTATTTSITLAWSRSNVEDFVSYSVLRRSVPGVTVEEALEVAVLTGQDLLTHVDERLRGSTAYYYRILVTDSNFLTSLSNEIMVITPGFGVAPDPVTLHPAVPQTHSIDLVWSTNYDTDFYSYTVLRSVDSGVGKDSAEPIAIFYEYDHIAYTDEGLPPETSYYYRILVTDSDDLDSLSNEVFTTTLAIPPPEPVNLYPPVDLTDTSALLAWSLAEETDFDRYTLLRSDSAGVTEESTPVVVYTNVGQARYQDAVLTPTTTYFYRVMVANDSGLAALSNELEVTTPATPNPEEPEPVDLFPPVDRALTSISLMWSMSHETDFLSYRLLRADEPGVTEENGTSLIVYNDAGQTTFTDSDLTPATTYYYRVLVTNEEPLSALSNEIAVTTLSRPAPEAPARVELYPPVEVTLTSISVAWSVNYDADFVGYTLLHSNSPGVTEETGTAIEVFSDFEDVTTTHFGLSPAETHYYRVMVTNAAGLSSLSNEISGTTLGLPEPAVPVPVSLFPPVEVTATSVSLAWSVNGDDDFESYTVLRGPSPNVTTESGASVGDYASRLFISHDDGELPSETTYYYRVMVTDSEGLSSLSNEIEVTTLTPSEPLAPDPVTLFDPYGLTSNSLTLNWTVSYAEDFESYVVLRHSGSISDSDSGEVVFTTVDRNSVLFHDTELDPETTYYYRVVTRSSVTGLTSLSNEVTGTTLEVAAADLPTPVALGVAYNIKHDSLSLSWTQNADTDFASYELYRSETPGVTQGDLLVAGIVDWSDTTAVDDGLSPFTTYFYRVWVFNEAGESIGSNEVSGTTAYDAPPAPVVLHAPTAVTGHTMTLSWDQSAAEDFGSYRLRRSETPIIDATTAAIYETPVQGSLTFNDSGRQPVTTYYYRIYVVDEWGIESGSNIVSATTTDTPIPACAISTSHNWRPTGSTFDVAAVGCVDDGPLWDLEIRWNFGAGAGFEGYTDYDVGSSHSYPGRGAYWVELEVTDGEYSSTARTPLVVHETVPIPGGFFLMGIPGDSPWVEAQPQRRVNMSAYSIGRFEVTVGEFAAFLSDGNSSHWWPGEVRDNFDGTYEPIPGKEDVSVRVSYAAARAFCQWAGNDLTTEAQWEYAARGPETGPNFHFPWGNTLPGAMVPAPANYLELVGDLVDVDLYPTGVTAWDPSVVIYQMAGNSAEWVLDYYHAGYYQWAQNNGDNTNPDGPDAPPFAASELVYRATRGGGDNADDNLLRVYMRTYQDPLGQANGFRCASP